MMNSLVPLGNRDLLLKEQVDHILLPEVESLKRACEIFYEKSPKTNNYAWARDRDRLLFTLMWVTGGRVSDVVKMSAEKIDFKERTITFMVKKRKSDKKKNDGRFWHTILIDDETLHEISAYAMTYNIRGNLFPSFRKSTQTLNRAAVNQKLIKYGEIVGMRHIKPHMFRHGIAMYLQSQGIPVEVISHHLAHSSTAITLSTYARMSAAQERDIFRALNARLR